MLSPRANIEAALYHMSRCKMPGFLAPIEFQIAESDRDFRVSARVTSWPQHEHNLIVTFSTCSNEELFEPATKITTESFEKKIFTTSFVIDKSEIRDKSLYEIADKCNNIMKEAVVKLCRGMVDELWEC